jgi:hypothetical protein
MNCEGENNICGWLPIKSNYLQVASSQMLIQQKKLTLCYAQAVITFFQKH